MYGLPPDVDFSFFTGKTLLQICIGAHDLILNFDGSIAVTVVSSINCTTPGGQHQTYENFQQAAAFAANLVNKVVVTAHGDPAGTLTLEFHGGDRLSIFDDSKHYESYTVKAGNRMIVV